MIPLLPFVLQLASTAVVTAVLEAFGKQVAADVKWTDVKISMDERLRVLVPGEMLDDSVIRFANSLVDRLQMELRTGGVGERRVVELLIGGNWEEAGTELVKLAFPGV